MAGINDLPIELYELIFRNNSSIKDLTNYRLVNKKFKFATYKCVTKLVIGRFDLLATRFDRYEHDHWFHDNELIDNDQMISSKSIREIRSIFDLNSYLKYLIINVKKCNYKEFEKELTNLNKLINLECLEINCIDDDLEFKIDYSNLKLNINLKNLEYFKLNVRYLKDACELNTPKLKKIQFYSFKIKDRPQILMKSNPESVKHLIINNYDDELKQFKNLEIIEYTDEPNFDENHLSFFNNLKQFRCQISLNTNLWRILNIFLRCYARDIDFYLNGDKKTNYQFLLTQFRSE